MIGKLKGTIDSIFEDKLLIEVNGICYIVFCIPKIMHKFAIKDNISLFICTLQKDEMLTLYGFQEYVEKELFELLISVQGVGSKMCINIMNDIEHNHLLDIIQQEDVQCLKKIPGIGIKIAQRIINELKFNKKIFTLYQNTKNTNTTLKQDATVALINLGFKKNDVLEIINKSNDSNIEDLIRNAMQKLYK